jgi:TetR/AcrR family transcriptional regulator, transcriptional repressor for nem operon
MKATATRAPENTRGKILQAAFDEFYKNGFQGGSLNRIVDEAGTTKGALFHHFKGKKDLGYAVVREVIHPHHKQQWSDSLAHSSDPITDLKRIFRQCAKREIASGGLVHGCPLNNLAQEMSPLDEKFRTALEKIYVEWRETVAAAFARGIKKGKVRKDVSPRKVAAFIVAAQAGMAGTAKNAQDKALLLQTGQALFDYLDSLKP